MAKQAQIDPREWMRMLEIPYWEASGGEEIRSHCPICHHPKAKLYMRVQPGDTFGVWHCKHCDQAGNLAAWIRSFLQAVIGKAFADSRGAGHPYWKERFGEEAGPRIADAQALGVWKGRHVIPIRTVSGEPFTLALRQDNREPKYLFLPHSPTPFHVASWPTEHKGEPKETYVVEGQLNAMAVYYMLWAVRGDDGLVGTRVIGLPGATTIPSALSSLLAGHVVAWFDQDTAGKKGFAKLKKLCPSVSVIRAEMDAADMLRSGRSLDQLTIEENGGLPDGPRAVPIQLYLAGGDTQPSWLVRECWLDGALGFIAGRPKSFKSYLALHLAAAVAGGTPFLGLPTDRSGPVLLVQEEDHDRVIRRRLAQLGVPADASIHIWTPGVAGEHIRLDTEEGLGYLDREMERIAPVLVILDPLANMHQLENENDAAAVNRVMEQLRFLRDRHQAAIAIVHHMRKGTGQERWEQTLRGSSVLSAKYESALFLDRTGESGCLTIRSETKLSPTRSIDVRFVADEAGARFVLESDWQEEGGQ